MSNNEIQQTTEEMLPSSYTDSIQSSVRAINRIGYWPKRNPSLKYRIYSITVLLLSIGNWISMIAAEFTNLDAETAAYGICLILAYLQAICKLLVMSFGKAMFFKMMKLLNDDSFTFYANLNRQHTSTIRTANLLRKLLYFLTLGTSTLSVLNALLGFSKRLTSLPTPFDLEHMPVGFYILISILHAFSATWIALITASYDGFIVVLMSVAVIQLRILRANITNAFDPKLSGSSKGKNHNRRINEKLKECVNHHILIEQYINSIEEMFGYLFLLQMVESLFATVFVGFTVFISVTSNPTLLGKVIFFLLAAIYELSCYCIPGNEIILQSGKITNACYMSNWTECNTSVRRTLIIIMERSKRPLKLTAKKLVIFSFENYLAMLRSSYSYFTLMRRIYSK